MRTKQEISSRFAPKSELEGKKSLFFVGIGGAGMSGIAELALSRGYRVCGSDPSVTPAMKRLGVLGIHVNQDQGGKIPHHVDAAIFSDAIDLDTNPDAIEAQNRGLPMFRRSQLLGSLVKDWKVIAVTGTHGKTTTTGLLGSAMAAAGLDPLVIVGAPLVGWLGPIRPGYGDWAVVEACEAYNGILDIDPDHILLTNLELDHVDFHGNFQNLESSIIEFLNKVGPDGSVVYCESDRGAREAVAKSSAQKVGYGPPNQPLHLSILGQHNQLNAAGALTMIRTVFGEEKAERAVAGLIDFKGAKRRLETVQNEPVTVIDDYAHTPREITSSLDAVRSAFPNKELMVVYQPHLYSRTQGQEAAFAEALSLADQVVLTDIYPARETPIPGVSSAVVAEFVSKPHHYVPNRHLLPQEVAKWAKEGQVVVGMGAGTIESFVGEFIEEFDHKLEIRSTQGFEPKKVKVAVLWGGSSSEREVSLLSGRYILSALQKIGFNAYGLDISDLALSGRSIAQLSGPSRPDIVFLAVHGTDAEDGSIQGFLDLLHIPYTGSRLLASAKAMDKALTKSILESEGIRVPKGVKVGHIGDLSPLPLPVVVKPNAEGSTIGLSFVREHEEYGPAIRRALAYGSYALVEEEIVGMEVSTPVLCGKALLPVEIVPKAGVYDYKSKYTSQATEEIVPARLPTRMLQKCQDVAVACHRILGCEGATRTDMIIDKSKGDGQEVVVLEINTLPGMTATSLLPASASADGISYEELCRRIVIDGLERGGS